MRNNYVLIDEDDVPECCGSCEYMRIKNSKVKCFFDGEMICTFGHCDDYEPKENIFEED